MLQAIGKSNLLKGIAMKYNQNGFVFLFKQIKQIYFETWAIEVFIIHQKISVLSQGILLNQVFIFCFLLHEKTTRKKRNYYAIQWNTETYYNNHTSTEQKLGKVTAYYVLLRDTISDLIVNCHGFMLVFFLVFSIPHQNIM